MTSSRLVFPLPLLPQIILTPIEAGSSSASARFRKFVTRNAVIVIYCSKFISFAWHSLFCSMPIKQIAMPPLLCSASLVMTNSDKSLQDADNLCSVQTAAIRRIGQSGHHMWIATPAVILRQALNRWSLWDDSFGQAQKKTFLN